MPPRRPRGLTTRSRLMRLGDRGQIVVPVRRVAYYKDPGDTRTLSAQSSALNSSKQASGPDARMPPKNRCAYTSQWTPDLDAEKQASQSVPPSSTAGSLPLGSASSRPKQIFGGFTPCGNGECADRFDWDTRRVPGHRLGAVCGCGPVSRRKLGLLRIASRLRSSLRTSRGLRLVEPSPTLCDAREHHRGPDESFPGVPAADRDDNEDLIPSHTKSCSSGRSRP
jgi:hypothetical protein